MDSCRLPIETCEKIMDNVQTLPRPAFGYNTFPYDQLSGPLVTMQANLGACALTCRAWSVHARFLLRQYVVLLPQTLERFLTTIRVQPECADSVTFLCLTRRWRGAGLLAGSDITPFLLRSFPKLRHIILEDVDVSGSLTAENRERHKMHPKLLRMRPPMLAHLTELVLHNCNFSLDRTFCDLIWACLQLRSLVVINCTIGPKDFPPAGRMLLPVAARKLKIAHVSLLGSNFLWQPPVGVFLGASVTSLKIGYIFDILGSGLQKLMRFVSDTFPNLLELSVFFEGCRQPEGAPPRLREHTGCLLHLLATELPNPGLLRVLMVSFMVNALVTEPQRLALCDRLFGGEVEPLPSRTIFRHLENMHVVFVGDKPVASSYSEETREEKETIGVAKGCVSRFRTFYPSMHEVAFTICE